MKNNPGNRIDPSGLGGKFPQPGPGDGPNYYQPQSARDGYSGLDADLINALKERADAIRDQNSRRDKELDEWIDRMREKQNHPFNFPEGGHLEKPDLGENAEIVGENAENLLEELAISLDSRADDVVKVHLCYGGPRNQFVYISRNYLEYMTSAHKNPNCSIGLYTKPGIMDTLCHGAGVVGNCIISGSIETVCYGFDVLHTCVETTDICVRNITGWGGMPDNLFSKRAGLRGYQGQPTSSYGQHCENERLKGKTFCEIVKKPVKHAALTGITLGLYGVVIAGKHAHQTGDFDDLIEALTNSVLMLWGAKKCKPKNKKWKKKKRTNSDDTTTTKTNDAGGTSKSKKPKDDGNTSTTRTEDGSVEGGIHSEISTPSHPIPNIPQSPTSAPGPDWEWRGMAPVGGDKGAWFNPNTRETMHPDLHHGGSIGPHWDWRDPDGNFWRLFPDGRIQSRG